MFGFHFCFSKPLDDRPEDNEREISKIKTATWICAKLLQNVTLHSVVESCRTVRNKMIQLSASEMHVQEMQRIDKITKK